MAYDIGAPTWLPTFMKAAAATPPAAPPYTVANPTLSYLERLRAGLKQAGFQAPVLDYALVLCYMESGGFTNRGAQENNPGNIMWNEKSKYKRGTYNQINRTYYNSYKSLLSFSQHLKQVLSQSPGKPIDATDSKDFVNRLAANRYWNIKEASIDQYYNALKGAAGRINLLSQMSNNQAALNNYAATYKQDQVPNWFDGVKQWFDTAPTIQKVGAGVAVALILKSFFK